MWYIVNVLGWALCKVDGFGVECSSGRSIALSFESKNDAETFLAGLISLAPASSLRELLHVEFCDE